MCAAALLSGCTESHGPQVAAAFDEARAMAAALTMPAFASDTLNVLTLGADTAGSAEANQKAIQAAIDSLTSTKGGVVLVPAGKYLTGPLTLKDNVNLHIAAGAELLFDTNVQLYASCPVPTHWEGMELTNMHPLIYANEATNIALTGQGTVNGQAD